MARHTLFPTLKRQIEQQRALGRSATQLDIIPAAEFGSGWLLSLTVGPRTVLVGLTGSGAMQAQKPWQLYPQAELDQALRKS